MRIVFEDPDHGSRDIKGMDVEYDSPFPESNRSAMAPRYFVVELTGTRTPVVGPFLTVSQDDGWVIRPYSIRTE